MKAFPDSATPFQQGMDLRDYFAAKSLQAILSSQDTNNAIANERINAIDVAKATYMWADLMMKAREQK